jgi:hypothetical protein
MAVVAVRGSKEGTGAQVDAMTGVFWGGGVSGCVSLWCSYSAATAQDHAHVESGG